MQLAFYMELGGARPQAQRMIIFWKVVAAALRRKWIASWNLKLFCNYIFFDNFDIIERNCIRIWKIRTQLAFVQIKALKIIFNKFVSNNYFIKKLKNSLIGKNCFFELGSIFEKIRKFKQFTSQFDLNLALTIPL